MQDLWVAVDLDDVVLDFTGGVRRAVQTEYGITVPPFQKWEMHEVLDPIIGKSWWKWMRERDWLWPNFPAIEGAIGALAKMRDAGYYVEIVTAKPEWAEFSVWKWMGKWRPPVNRVTIVDMNTRKVDITGADVLVDDKPGNVNEFEANGRLGILFPQLHNVQLHVLEGVVRATGWPSVLEILQLEKEEVL